MKATSMPKQITKSKPCKAKIIAVPTFRRKPLRMITSQNYQAVTSTTPSSNLENPFLYFSLSRNQHDGRYHAHEDIDTQVDSQPERRRHRRFDAEVHPWHTIVGELLAEDFEDEVMSG